MKLRANKNGEGYISNYTISLGCAEARALGFTREDGSGRELVKEIDAETGTLTVRVNREAEEKAE